MPSRGKSPRGRWAIPENMTPDGVICFCINWPDDAEHIAIFWGMLYDLTFRYNWGEPLTADSETMAAFYREIINDNRAEYEASIKMANKGCGCESPTGYRITDDFRIERTFDGINYEPDPEDPRFNGILFPSIPIVGGSDCDAAHTARVTLNQAFDELLSNADIWTVAVTFITAVCGWLIKFFPIPGIACVIISTVAASILQIGRTVIDAALTDEVYDCLECIFYCHISNTGLVTDAAWDAIRSDVNTDPCIEGAARTFLWNMLTIIGPDGLTNAARTLPTLDGDCSECACEPCQRVYLLDRTTDTWVRIQPEEPDGNTYLLTSTSNGTREEITMRFGNPADPHCCEALDWEQTAGNQIFITSYLDCDGDEFSSALPHEGCVQGVTILSNLEPEPPMTWRLTVGTDCE